MTSDHPTPGCMKLHVMCGDGTGSCVMCDPSLSVPQPLASDTVRNLRRVRHPQSSRRPGLPFNPDGAEAADLIEAQAAEIEARDAVIAGFMNAVVFVEGEGGRRSYSLKPSLFPAAYQAARTLTERGQ